MDLEALLDDLSARRILVTERAGALVVAPSGTLDPGERELLRAHKEAALALVRARRAREVAALPIGQLEAVVEFSAPWTDRTLFLAPTPTARDRLTVENIDRGRVWDRVEVGALLSTGVESEDAQRIGLAKLQFQGAVIAAWRS